jgi:hypothetical protein
VVLRPLHARRHQQTELPAIFASLAILGEEPGTGGSRIYNLLRVDLADRLDRRACVLGALGISRAALSVHLIEELSEFGRDRAARHGIPIVTLAHCAGGSGRVKEPRRLRPCISVHVAGSLHAVQSGRVSLPCGR